MTKSLDHIDNCVVGFFFLGQLFRKGLIYFCWGSKKVSNLKLEQNALLQEISLLIEYHQTLLIDALNFSTVLRQNSQQGKNYSGNLSQ